MLLTCWICNPYCGRCKPPMPKPVKCTHCGKHTIPDSIDPKCKKCGARLTGPEITVIRCSYSGLLCANPCGKSKSAPDTGEFAACYRNTPPPAKPLNPME